MARIFADGFEMNSGQLWDTFTCSLPTSPPVGFSGTYYCSVGFNQHCAKRFNQAYPELYISTKFMSGAYGTIKPVIAFADSVGTIIATVSERVAGMGTYLDLYRGEAIDTLLVQGTTDLVSGTVHLLEVYYKPLNSGGVFTIKLDGIVEATFTGDTTDGLEDVERVALGSYGGNGNGSKFDDFVVDDADWIGITALQKLQITGAGTTTQWDPSAGANYECVDELGNANDSDYISTNVAAELDTFAAGDMVGDIATIKALYLIARMFYEGVPATDRQRVTIRVNGSHYYGPRVAPGLSAINYMKIWELNPDDAAAWEESDINAIEIGVSTQDATTSTTTTTTTTSTTTTT